MHTRQASLQNKMNKFRSKNALFTYRSYFILVFELKRSFFGACRLTWVARFSHAALPFGKPASLISYRVFQNHCIILVLLLWLRHSTKDTLFHSFRTVQERYHKDQKELKLFVVLPINSFKVVYVLLILLMKIQWKITTIRGNGISTVIDWFWQNKKQQYLKVSWFFSPLKK